MDFGPDGKCSNALFEEFPDKNPKVVLIYRLLNDLLTIYEDISYNL